MVRHMSDDEAYLRRRARRRLVGAVTLVTLVVVLLPMLLDSEPRMAGQDIELRIPDMDTVGEFMPKVDVPSAPVAAPLASSVAPAAGPAAPSQASTPTGGSNPVAVPQTGFVVQVGAFANAGSALQLQKKLNKQGIKTYTEKVDDKTRVRAGPFPTREAADKVRRKLEAQGLEPVISPVQ